LSEKRKDITIIEPYTKITGFDGLGFAAQRSLIGAVGGHLFPNEKDKEKKTKFYVSPVGRRNKQKVAQLVSEVYAYLNTLISEHADPRQYYFRLIVRMEMDNHTGEIYGEPYFDIDVFRHIGKIGGKPTESKGLTLKVVFVGKEDVPISTIFIKGVSEAVKNTGMIDFKPYESYTTAPKEIRDKITKTLPYLLIGDEVYKIKVKVDEAYKVTSFIEDSNQTFEFNSENDVALFLLKKIPFKPQIIGSETAFEPVDQEILQFSTKIIGNMELKKEKQNTFDVPSLGIDSFLIKVSKKFAEVDKTDLIAELSKKFQKQQDAVEAFRQNYERIKTNYEVTLLELDQIEKERNEGIIEEDSFRCTKKRRLLALTTLRSELIKVHQEMQNEVLPET
jgi:hypothetical protein